MLKFPKPFSEDPKAPALASYLSKRSEPLRPDSPVRVPRLAGTNAIRQMLVDASRSKAVVVGLEQIDATLAKEEKGLEAVRQKTGQPKTERMSRLIVVTNDGSDRFYRGVEAILRNHGYRVAVIQLAMSAEQLGKALVFEGNLCRAVMINDKTWVARTLAALAPSSI